MGPIGYIIGAALLIGAGAVGVEIYKKKHAHSLMCPTDAQVQKAVTDLDTNSNGMTIPSAIALANGWEQAGCAPAAYALRAMIAVRKTQEDLLAAASHGGKLVPAVLNWIPGCVAPAGFIPPGTWAPGVVATSSDLPGWTPPDGWKVGDPLPTDYACPPGWTKTVSGGGGTSSVDAKLDLSTKGFGGNEGLGKFAAVGAVPGASLVTRMRARMNPRFRGVVTAPQPPQPPEAHPVVAKPDDEYEAGRAWILAECRSLSVSIKHLSDVLTYRRASADFQRGARDGYSECQRRGLV